jgi:hypothetical protein
MRLRLAGAIFNNYRQLAPAVLLLLGLSSCSLFKKSEPSGDEQVSAASAAASAAPAANAVGRVVSECVLACRRSYRDCASKIGDADRREQIGKCREIIKPCIAACK